MPWLRLAVSIGLLCHFHHERIYTPCLRNRNEPSPRRTRSPGARPNSSTWPTWASSSNRRSPPYRIVRHSSATSRLKRSFTATARNAFLILYQRTEATRVAGYTTWQKLGRQVCRGRPASRSSRRRHSIKLPLTPSLVRSPRKLFHASRWPRFSTW
jgi:hypothetical protein